MSSRDPDSFRRVEDREMARSVTEVAEKAKEVESMFDSFLGWAHKFRAIFVLLSALTITVAGAVVSYASWAGAQVSAPGQRITGLETRHDSLLLAVRAIELDRANFRRRMDSTLMIQSRRQLLQLRITCATFDPRIRDLLDDCRELGASR